MCMKKIFIYSLVLGLCTTGLTSCNDDEDQTTDTRVTYFAQLELLGDEFIEMNVGETFTDPGFVATEAGEDITAKVVVTGSVNTSVGAFYRLNYSVSNVDGFAVSAQRLVMVKDPDNFASAYYGESQYGTRHYYGAPITISDLGGGNYLIDDILGGFYAYGRYPNYSLDFLLEAVIHLNDDNTIELVQFGDWYWGSDVPDLIAGSYDPATGTVSLELDFGSPFLVTLTK